MYMGMSEEGEKARFLLSRRTNQTKKLRNFVRKKVQKFLTSITCRWWAKKKKKAYQDKASGKSFFANDTALIEKSIDWLIKLIWSLTTRVLNFSTGCRLKWIFSFKYKIQKRLNNSQAEVGEWKLTGSHAYWHTHTHPRTSRRSTNAEKEEQSFRADAIRSRSKSKLKTFG